MLKSTACIAMFFIFVAQTVAQNDSVVRKQLQSEYERLSKSFVKRDVDAIMNTLSADATLTYLSGKKVIREQVESDLRTSLPKLNIISVSHKISQIRTVGGKAVAMVNVRQVLRTIDAKKKPHTIEFRIPYRDTWTRKGAGWIRQSLVEAGKPVMLRDGVPVPAR